MDGGNWIVYILGRLCHLGFRPNLLLKYSTLAPSNWPAMGHSVGRSWVVVSAWRKTYPVNL